MPEGRQYDDGSRTLTFSRGAPECRALETAYAGLKFNRLHMLFLPIDKVREDPDCDDLDVEFNVSGSGEDLLTHGFAHPSWWTLLASSGLTRSCRTPGFGRTWLASHTRSGYRLQGAHYDDGLTKLARALVGYWVVPKGRLSTLIKDAGQPTA